MPEQNNNPLDTIRGLLEPIAKKAGTELDEDALKQWRDYCEDAPEA